MTTKLEQAIADLEGKRSERAYGAWRSWSHEYAMKEIERTLSGEEAADLDRSLGGQPSAASSPSRRGVWVAMVVASIVGVIAWGLIFLLGRAIVRAVYG